MLWKLANIQLIEHSVVLLSVEVFIIAPRRHVLKMEFGKKNRAKKSIFTVFCVKAKKKKKDP